MSKKFAPILFLLFPILLFSQKKPMKFGDVKPSSLAMTSYEKDLDADGVVLCNYGDLSFIILPREGFKYLLKQHKRIKIFKRSAFEQADISIRFHKDFQRVTGLKANVFSPDGTKREISKKDFFEEKIEDGWTAKKIALPNIEEGSVIEYKYNLESNSLGQLRPWYFSESLPTIWSEFRVAIPEYFKYHRHAHGWGSFTVTDCKDANGSTGSFKFKEERCRYVAEHLPGYKKEAYITTLDDYFFKMRFQLRAIDAGLQSKSFLSTWKEIAEVLRESDHVGTQYLKKRSYNKMAEACADLLTGSDAEILKNVSTYLLENIKITNYSSTYFSEKSLDDAFEKKLASKAERNLMLLALLRAKGMEATPVYISTRDNGRPISVQPNIRQFNHILVHVRVGEEYHFLDLSNEYRPADLLAPNCLSLEGFEVKDNFADWVKIPKKLSSLVILSNVAVNENGDISGTFQTNEKGYQAAYSRATLDKKQGADFWKETLAESFSDPKISDFKTETQKDIHAPFKADFTVTLPGAAQVNDNLMYLSPIFYTDFDENPFKLEKRNFPVDFPYPLKEQLVLNIEIPKNYAVEELPESVSIVLPEGGGKFQFRVSQKPEGGIQVISKIEIKQLLFLPEEYPTIKNFWDLIAEKMGEQIVLKKV